MTPLTPRQLSALDHIRDCAMSPTLHGVAIDLRRWASESGSEELDAAARAFASARRRLADVSSRLLAGDGEAETP